MGAGKPKRIESPVGAEVVIEGRRYINFAGSSYLGLSANAEALEAGRVALLESGAGYQFHRHFQVATRAHQDAEQEAARFFNTEAALYLAGGYYFGLVALAAIRSQFDAIFFDELAHHSLREAIAASGLTHHAFRHLDAPDLAARLKRQLRARERPLIVTDGMFSTFGEIAPLHELVTAMAPYSGRLLVDESHGFGVLGSTGRGANEHHGISVASIVIGGSTGKAFGVAGGIVPASEDEVAALRMTPAGRGAAAGLPAAAAMCATNLRYVRQHPQLLQRLRANTVYLKSGLRRLGLDIPDTIAPVASFVAGDDRSMRALQEQLMCEGIFVLHSHYIGADKAGVIRCGIFSDHTSEHLDSLIRVLRRLL